MTIVIIVITKPRNVKGLANGNFKISMLFVSLLDLFELPEQNNPVLEMYFKNLYTLEDYR